MAHISIQAKNFGFIIGFVERLTHSLAACFVGIGRFLIRLSEANARTHRIEYLKALSDAELRDNYGINRNQIICHVFRDKLYL